jgi:hypothetical protein
LYGLKRRIAAGLRHSGSAPHSKGHAILGSPRWVMLKPLAHDGYLSELTGLRDLLKSGLSGARQKEGTDNGSSVSELAGRLKVIKAAHNVEATPERVRQKQTFAEEPITSQIRMRKHAIPVTNEVTELDGGMPAKAFTQSCTNLRRHTSAATSRF